MKTVLSPFVLIVVVALIGMLAPFSIDTYLPSFPSIEAELQASRAMLSQTLAVYLACFALATLFWGPMADKWGRRPIILGSLLGYLVSSIVCALANSYELLLFGRALQGVMAAGSLVASRAMIRDYFQGQDAQRAMAVMMMLFTAAPALAPIIGGWLEVHLGWRSVFYFLAAYALLIVSLFYFRVIETQNPAHVQSIHPANIARSYWQSLLHPQFLQIVAAQGFLIGGFFVYVAGAASLIYDHLHWSEQEFWLFFVPVVSGVLIGSIMVHRLTHRYNSRTLITAALSLGIVSVVVNVFLESQFEAAPWMVISPLVLYAIGFAMANPGLSIAALDCLPSRRGIASSMQSLFQMGTAGLVAAVVVPLVEQSLQWMAIAQALLFSVTVLLWLNVRRAI